MMDGVAYAVIGTLATSVGHFVMRCGHQTKKTYLRPLGLFVSDGASSVFDVLARSRAPSMIVAPLGVFVVVWNVLIAAALARALPTRENLVGAAVAVVGTVVVVVSGPDVDADGDSPNAALAAYTLLCLCALVWTSSAWSLGALAGCTGAFLKASMRGDWLVSGPVVVAIALAHAVGLDKIVAESDPAKVVPLYVVAMSLSGCLAGAIAFDSLPRDPLVFGVGVVVAVAGAALVKPPARPTARSTTPWTS